MRNGRRFLGVIGLIAGCLITIRLQAATIYSYYYVAGQASYTVAASSSITVPLYLEEVNSDQSTNSLLANEHGLTAAGVNVSYFSGSATSTITGAAASTGSVPTGFDDAASTGTVNSITSATITESTDPPPFGTDLVGVAAGAQTNGVSQVYLGTVTILASSPTAQQTTFTVGVADAENGNTFTNDHNYDLDNNGDPLNPAGASSLYFSAASTLFTVNTSVPEPTGFCGLLLFGVTALGRPGRERSIDRSRLKCGLRRSIKPDQYHLSDLSENL